MKIGFLAMMLLFCTSLSATDYYWRGGAGDGKWSSPGNWQPEGVPTSADSVVFDEHSVGNVLIDEDSPLTGGGYVTVNIFTMTNFTGEIVLGKPFSVTKTYEQHSGTFTCNDKVIRIGGTKNRGEGNFLLKGGVFNAPSTEFRYDTSSHLVSIVMADAAVYNHNYGDFLFTAQSGGGYIDTSIINKTFYNFKTVLPENSTALTRLNFVRPDSSTYACTNTVLGTFHFGAGYFFGPKVDNTVMNFIWIVKGDVEISRMARGGNAAFLFNGENDQTVTQLDSSGQSCGFIVDKPENAKLYVKGGYPFTFNLNEAKSGSGFLGFEFVRGGGVDFSDVPSIYFKSYHTKIIFPSKDKIVLPDLVKVEGYDPRFKARDLVFKNLTVGTTDSRMNVPENSTNTVLGTFTVTAGGMNTSSAYIELKGDYVVTNSYNVDHAKNYGGGTAKVLMNAESDQKIILAPGTTCNSLVINKPAGSRVTVESDDGVLRLGHINGSVGYSYHSGEGSFYMKGGVLDVSKGGIYQMWGCYGSINQSGGEILWGPLGLKVQQGKGGHKNTLSFGEYRVPKLEVTSAAEGVSTITISGTLHVDDLFVNRMTIEGGKLYIYGDHTVSADTKAFTSEVHYVGDADQTLFVESGNMYDAVAVYLEKTGGTLRLGSDVNMGKWRRTFNLSEGSLDVNGHTLTLNGNVYLSGRMVFSKGCGQIKVVNGILYPQNDATIAFAMPTADDQNPFLHAGDIYFPAMGVECTITAEVLDKVSRDAKSYATLAVATNSICTHAYSSFANRPKWEYKFPQTVKKPSIKYTPLVEGGNLTRVGGTIDFSCRLRFPGFSFILK